MRKYRLIILSLSTINCGYTILSMPIEKEGRSMSDFWSRLALDAGIVSFTGSTYINHASGTESHNIPLSETEAVSLLPSIRERAWRGSLSKDSNPIIDATDRILALGSLVYICPDMNTQIELERAFSQKPDQLTFSDLESVGARPMAIVMVDLDCPNSDDNFGRVHQTLKKNYRGTEWSVFDSGNSFHLILNRFVEPIELPKQYGEIIVAFAKDEAEDQKKYFTKIGRDLIESGWDPKKIITVCEEILEKVSHFDNTPNSSGLHFMVDLRWMAHSLRELINFLQGGQGSFAYLRVGKKNEGGPEPKLKAISRIHKKVNGKIVSTSLDD